MKESDLSFEYVSSLLSYDQLSGELTWLVRRGPCMAGDIAGYIERDQYCRVWLGGRNRGAHRIAWLLTTKEWPRHEIDHKDGCRSNNRLANLRPATPSENKRNVCISKRNTTGYKGVTRNSVGCRKPFKATIYVNKKNRVIGSFYTAKEAHEAYCSAADKYFGEFARAA